MRITAEVKPWNGTGIVLAKATVTLWNDAQTTALFEIRGVTIMRGKDGGPWVAWPSSEYEKDGQKKRIIHIYPGPGDSQEATNVRNSINAAVLEYYKNAPPAPPQQPFPQQPVVPQSVVPSTPAQQPASQPQISQPKVW